MRGSGSTAWADRQVQRLHAGDGVGDAGGIPHFEGAEFPVEAGAHGVVDGGGVVGDFADAVGGEVPERGEKRPEEGGGFVFGGVVGEEQAQALGEGGGVFRHFERGEAGLASGAVVEGGEIEDQALVFAVGAADFLVEALAGFVAEPAALHHFVEDRRRTCPCGYALRKVGGDVGEDVDADQIGEAKGSGAGPADGGAGERVDFFDGEALLEHEVGGVEHDGDADAVGDEVGRVVGEDDLLAEEAVGEGGEGGDGGGIGVGGWG